MRGEKRLQAAVKDLRHAVSPAGRTRCLLVLGCQRSGTDAFVGCFERDRNAKVYRERCSLNVVKSRTAVSDSDRFMLRLRPLEEVAERLDHVRFPLAVAKPLVESQRIEALLDRLPRSRAVWLFRHYLDVAESNARTFGAAAHRSNLAPIATGDPGNWRSEAASEDVIATVRDLYRPDMEPIDGHALFWWARNRLLFDSGARHDARVLPVEYLRFATEPLEVLTQVYEHAGAAPPGPEVAAPVSAKHVGKASSCSLSAPVERLCEDLWQDLRSLAHAGAPAGQRSPARSASSSVAMRPSIGH